MLKDTLLKLLNIEGLVNNLTGYIETRVELLKIEVKEEMAKAFAKAVVLIIGVASFTLFLVFISITLAILIGKYLGLWVGFAIVTGIYLAIGLLFSLMREKISQTIERKLIKQMNKKEYGVAGDE